MKLEQTTISRRRVAVRFIPQRLAVSEADARAMLGDLGRTAFWRFRAKHAVKQLARGIFPVSELERALRAELKGQT